MDLIELEKKHIPFNNSVETGLRVLTILHQAFPISFDLQKIVYLDYLNVHLGDFDNSKTSIHVAVPYRQGEIFVRNRIILKGIQLFISKGLIDTIYSTNGIEYKASEIATPFLENLEEEYVNQLKTTAVMVCEMFAKKNNNQLKKLIRDENLKIAKTYNLELLK